MYKCRRDTVIALFVLLSVCFALDRLNLHDFTLSVPRPLNGIHNGGGLAKFYSLDDLKQDKPYLDKNIMSLSFPLYHLRPQQNTGII